MQYRGWDVHAYTNEWAVKANEHRDVLSVPVAPSDADVCLKDMITHGFSIPPLLSQRFCMTDTSLGCVNIGRLTFEIWKLIKDKKDLHGLFREILADMDATCLEGYSHRLLSMWVACMD